MMASVDTCSILMWYSLKRNLHNILLITVYDRLKRLEDYALSFNAVFALWKYELEEKSAQHFVVKDSRCSTNGSTLAQKFKHLEKAFEKRNGSTTLKGLCDNLKESCTARRRECDELKVQCDEYKSEECYHERHIHWIQRELRTANETMNYHNYN